MAVARALFPWFGGKAVLAPRIVELLPVHDAYVEPFGGAANVMLTKRPSRLDVYNDVDEGLVGFFRVLRERPDELAAVLELTPYSRREFEIARGTWRSTEDELERVRRWFVWTWQRYAGDQERSSWGSDVLGRRNGSRSATWARRIGDLREWAGRWAHVQVECADWRVVLDRYDAPTACFYLDPPYLPETRLGGGYAHELTREDHEELVERVRGLAGAVVLSGYDSALYRQLEDDGFERFEFPSWTGQGNGRTQKRSPRLEVVWRRGDVAQQRLEVAC